MIHVPEDPRTELLGNNRFGRCKVYLLSEREPRGYRKSEAERLYKKGPRAQERVKDITADNLGGDGDQKMNA